MGHFQQHSYSLGRIQIFPLFFILGDSKVVFVQGCYKVVYKVVTRLLQGWLQGCYKVVTRLLQGCYKVVTRLLQGCYRVNCIPVTRL